MFPYTSTACLEQHLINIFNIFMFISNIFRVAYTHTRELGKTRNASQVFSKVIVSRTVNENKAEIFSPSFMLLLKTYFKLDIYEFTNFYCERSVPAFLDNFLLISRKERLFFNIFCYKHVQ